MSKKNNISKALIVGTFLKMFGAIYLSFITSLIAVSLYRNLLDLIPLMTIWFLAIIPWYFAVNFLVKHNTVVLVVLIVVLTFAAIFLVENQYKRIYEPFSCDGNKYPVCRAI